MICMEVDGMKRVLFKVILPLAFVAVWLNMCYWICLGENGVANVGRLLTGKGTKEVSDEKEGVALTRVLNMPVKKHISALKKQVERIDGAVAKLDKICAGLDTGKDKEKSRVSVKEKLSQMKVKSEQQKKEPEKSKTKSQEASL